MHPATYIKVGNGYTTSQYVQEEEDGSAAWGVMTSLDRCAVHSRRGALHHCRSRSFSMHEASRCKHWAPGRPFFITVPHRPTTHEAPSTSNKPDRPQWPG